MKFEKVFAKPVWTAPSLQRLSPDDARVRLASASDPIFRAAVDRASAKV